MLRRKHPTISVLANLLRLAESRSVRESQRDSVSKPRVAPPSRRSGAMARREGGRHELPWEIVKLRQNLNGVASPGRITKPFGNVSPIRVHPSPESYDRAEMDDALWWRKS